MQTALRPGHDLDNPGIMKRLRSAQQRKIICSTLNNVAGHWTPGEVTSTDSVAGQERERGGKSRV